MLYAVPTGAEIDRDLFELACAVQDRVGNPWSSEALRDLVRRWTETVGEHSPLMDA